MQRQSNLPDTIELAIERAIDRRLPLLLRELARERNAISSNMVGHHLEDRFMSLQEAATVCGVHRTTLLRWEQRQLIPSRRKLPGQGTGWLKSEIANLLLRLDRTKPVISKNVCALSGDGDA
jgi:predicted DNA-binding transcriptional regulator AlpA